MEAVYRLPAVNSVSVGAPFRWLAQGWADMWRAPGPLLLHGLVIALISFAITYGIYVTSAAFWVLSLTFGFVFVAPVLAMGPYEAGRIIDQGGKVTLGRITFVRGALRTDVAYLGLALLLIYFFWGRIAQVVYGLSTWRLYHTAPEFIDFALGTPEGHKMMIVGTIVGLSIAFLAYAMVVVSAPMLLDPRQSVFSATATSVRSVTANPGPMVLWAVILLVALNLVAASGFVLMIVAFPWLGLASWRAYRELVADDAVAEAAVRPAAAASGA